MAALGGAAIGGATGGIIGALVGMGIPEVEAKHYDERVRGGHALVTVQAEDVAELDRARAIFLRHGAEDVSNSTIGGVGTVGRGPVGGTLDTGSRF